MSGVQVSDELKYAPKISKHSSYKFQQVVPNNGTNTQVISAAGLVTQFELPAVAYNLAKSYITFDQAILAQAEYTHAWVNCPPWQRLEVVTRNGVVLADISNFAQSYVTMGRYTKTASKFLTTYSDSLVQRIGTTNQVADTVVSGAGATAIDLKWRISCADLFNTVLSLNRTIAPQEILVVRITWNSAVSMGFSADAPGTGTITALAGDVSMSKINFMLAVELNQSLIATINRDIHTSGKSLYIPAVYSYKTAIPSASQHNVSLRFAGAHGVTLNSLYTLVLTGAEELTTRYTADESKIESFFTMLDSSRLQAFDVNVADASHEWHRRPFVDGKACAIDPSSMTNKFMWKDDFTGNDDQPAINQVLAGLFLDRERKLDLSLTTRTTPQAFNYYSSAVTTKMIIFTPQGIQLK